MAGMTLGLGLGLQRRGVGAALPAGPSDVVTSTDELDEATTGAFATLLMVGGVEPAVFAKTGGSAALTISGNQVVASGAQTEGEISLELTVTDALGRVLPMTVGYTVAAEIVPPYVPPNGDDPVIPDPEDPDFDGGGFETSPITDDTSNGIKVTGKNGGSATFLLDWGTPAAGSIYTMRYTADWSRMSRLGREAAVGFAFRDGNDFHLVGLRGNGAASTVMLASKIHGDFRKSNQFTLTNDGAAENGTKDGPNWLQVEIAGDGSTYTLRSSADGETWYDEYTDTLPVPLDAATDALQFGPGGYFTNQDKGVFSITIESYAEIEALDISGTPVLTATENAAYDGFTVSASGGVAPYVYSLVGTWPAGISIDADTGAVSGTPTEAGSFASLSVRVTDAALETAELDAFTLGVAIDGWIGNFEDATDQTVYTFAGIGIGAADVNRRIVVYAASMAGATIAQPALTIGGVAAGCVRYTASTFSAGFWIADVPTGTTADIVITFAASQNRCAIGVWALTTAGSVPLSALAGSSAGSNVTLSDLPVVTGGKLLTGSARSSGSSGTAIGVSWGGVDSHVERAQAVLETDLRYCCGDIAITETDDTRDLTVTRDAGTLFAEAVGIGIAAGSPYTPVLADYANDATSQTTYTFTTRNIGTANAARQILVCIAWSNSVQRTLSGITVGGSAATIIRQNANTAIVRIPYPTGTTADIVVTMSGSCTNMAIGIWDTRPRAMQFPVQSGDTIATGTSITVADIGVRKGGFLVGIARLVETGTASAVYNGTDTLSIAQQDNLATAAAVHLGCATTEDRYDVDPGVSTATSNSKRMMFVSFV